MKSNQLSNQLFFDFWSQQNLMSSFTFWTDQIRTCSFSLMLLCWEFPVSCLQGPQDVVPLHAQPDKVGWIRKFCGKGIFREIWKNRFIVLRGDQLFICEKEVSQGQGQPLIDIWVWRLDQMNIYRTSQGSTEYSWTVSFLNHLPILALSERSSCVLCWVFIMFSGYCCLLFWFWLEQSLLSTIYSIILWVEFQTWVWFNCCIRTSPQNLEYNSFSCRRSWQNLHLPKAVLVICLLTKGTSSSWYLKVPVAFHAEFQGWTVLFQTVHKQAENLVVTPPVSTAVDRQTDSQSEMSNTAEPLENITPKEGLLGGKIHPGATFRPSLLRCKRTTFPQKLLKIVV